MTEGTIADLAKARREKEKQRAKRMTEKEFARAQKNNQVVALCASFMIEYARLGGIDIDMKGQNEFGSYRLIVNFKREEPFRGGA